MVCERQREFKDDSEAFGLRNWQTALATEQKEEGCGWSGPGEEDASLFGAH